MYENQSETVEVFFYFAKKLHRCKAGERKEKYGEVI